MGRWKAIAIGKGSDTWIRSSQDVINLTDRQTQHCLWYNKVKRKQKTVCSYVPHRSSRDFTLSRRLFSLLFPSYPRRINIEAQNLLVLALWAVWKDPIAGYPFHPTTFARLVGCFLLFWDDFDDVVPCVVVRLVALSEVVVGYRPKPLGQTLEEARLWQCFVCKRCAGRVWGGLDGCHCLDVGVLLVVFVGWGGVLLS